MAAEEEFFEKIWYNRHLVLKSKIESGRENISPTIYDRAKEFAKEIEMEYGKENLLPHDDFEWGMMNGKLSALRWVLGDEWDFLDT